jgi:hypothetical protein
MRHLPVVDVEVPLALILQTISMVFAGRQPRIFVSAHDNRAEPYLR